MSDFSANIPFPLLPGSYISAYVEEGSSDDLIVVLSAKNGFAMRNRVFGKNCLFIADLDRHYYVTWAGRLALHILAHVERKNIRRVIFLGHSKGGFGALLLAGLCARIRPKRGFHVLAFNPQTSVMRGNANAAFYPSCVLLWANAARRPRLEQHLRGGLKNPDRALSGLSA